MKKKNIWTLNRVTVEQFKTARKTRLIIVLDNIRSLNNIGSIFRTCDAFAIECICLCGITATPPSVEIHKTALGAEDSVSWTYHEDTLECIDSLRREGYAICTLEQVENSVSLEKFPVKADGSYAVVVGNEVDGVAQQVVDNSDFCIEIPQHGTKHSLNVSVSAALAIWHFYLGLREKL